MGFERPLISVAVIALALALPVTGASAAGLFDFLFGGGRHSAPSAPPPVAPPLANAFADPSGGMGDGDRRESGPSVAYCVRLCDGHPFPVQSSSSSAQACASMCPAAQTKVFAGGSVDRAVATDGKRYSDLPSAFVYRKQLVANCTCNGKTAGGLVRTDAKSDPTLRAGDIVVTNTGLMSYRGGNGKNADFTPVQDKKLATIEIRPTPISAAALAANARAEVPPPRNVDEPDSKASRRRAQR
jgi:hypothetical protein